MDDRRDVARDAIREYAECRLTAEPQHAQIRTTPKTAYLFASALLRDVVHTEPASPYCALGKAMSLSHRERGIVQNMYARCRGAKCPHCVSHWLVQVLLRSFEMWDFAPELALHRHLFTSDAEWRNSKRARGLKAAYPGAFFWVRIGYDGAREVFVPGDAIGGERCEDPVHDVLDALLRAPAAGQRRYGGLPPVERGGSGWHAFELPQGTSPEDACRVCEGALGRPLKWTQQERRRGGSFYRRWIVRGLEPAEVDVVRRALEPLEQLARSESSERRELARLLRRWAAAKSES